MHTRLVYLINGCKGAHCNMLTIDKYLSGLVRPINFHFSVKTIVQQKIVGHAHTMGLHGVALAIVVVADVT